MRIILIVFCCISYSLQNFAQEQNKTLFQHTIQSEAFGEERQISVFLPARYLNFPSDSMGITVVLDAQYDQFFNQACGIIDYMVDSHVTIPTIVVGIHTTHRGKEFTPPALDAKDREDWKHRSGQAPLLHQHLRNEVFPLVASTYRTNSFRSLIGHSSAGRFVVHTLFSNAKDLFQAYVAISPPLDYDNYQVLNAAQKQLNEPTLLNAYLYCSTGDIGYREEEFGGHVDQLDSAINASTNASLIWERDLIQETGHWSCVAPSLSRALTSIGRTFSVDEKTINDFVKNDKQSLLSQIDEFYTERNNKFGYAYYPTAAYILSKGGEFHDDEDYENAKQTYLWGLKAWPKNVSLCISLAEVYKALENNAEALTYINRGLSSLEMIKNDVPENVYSRLKSKLDKLQSN